MSIHQICGYSIVVALPFTGATDTFEGFIAYLFVCGAIGFLIAFLNSRDTRKQNKDIQS